MRTPSRLGDKVQHPIYVSEYSRIDRDSFCRLVAMNSKKSRLCLICISAAVWMTYAIAANYATVWTVDDYARVVDGPPSTFHVVDAGWPIPFVQEYYSLARPNIAFEVDDPKLAINLLLVIVVQLSVIFLAYDTTVLTIRHLLLITAIVAIAASLARLAANQFGGTVTYSFVLFAYFVPVALASVRLLFHLIVGTLGVFRLNEKRGGTRKVLSLPNSRIVDEGDKSNM
jgi:hypothetical protein